jgi:hypothetical protein
VNTPVLGTRSPPPAPLATWALTWVLVEVRRHVVDAAVHGHPAVAHLAVLRQLRERNLPHVSLPADSPSPSPSLCPSLEARSLPEDRRSARTQPLFFPPEVRVHELWRPSWRRVSAMRSSLRTLLGMHVHIWRRHCWSVWQRQWLRDFRPAAVHGCRRRLHACMTIVFCALRLTHPARAARVQRPRRVRSWALRGRMRVLPSCPHRPGSCVRGRMALRRTCAASLARLCRGAARARRGCARCRRGRRGGT